MMVRQSVLIMLPCWRCQAKSCHGAGSAAAPAVLINIHQKREWYYNHVADVPVVASCRTAIFFLQTRIAIPRYFSQSYGAYFKYIIHVHVHVHTRTVNVCAMLMISYVILKYAPYDWLKCNPRLQKKNRCRACP